MGILLLGAIALLTILSSGEESEPEGDESNPEPAPPPGPAKKPTTSSSSAKSRHLAGFQLAVQKFKADNAAQLAEAEKIENYKGTQSTGQNAIAGGLAVAAAAANAIPVAGQVVGAALALLALLFKLLPTGVWLPRIEGKDFTGWRADSYWYHDIPIYGPEADRMLEPLPHTLLGDKGQSLEGLKRLIARFPSGPGWPVEISIFATGSKDDPYFDYTYLFNPYRPGDLSQDERNLEHVKGLQVYSPLDITPRGPRGFDPKAPLAWKVPGERRAKLDDVVKVTPGNAAAGI